MGGRCQPESEEKRRTPNRRAAMWKGKGSAVVLHAYPNRYLVAFFPPRQAFSILSPTHHYIIRFFSGSLGKRWHGV